MEDQLLCYENIKPQIKNLRLTGFYQIDPKSSKPKRFLHRSYMVLVLSLSIVYAVQEVMKLSEVYSRDVPVELGQGLMMESMRISSLHLFQCLKAVEIRHDVDKVIDIMFLMLTYSSSIYKEIIFWKDEDKIEELLDILKSPLFNDAAAEHRDLLLQRARQSRLLLRTFNSGALTTVFLWALYPLILFLQNKPYELAIWLPYDTDRSPHFFLTFLYIWIQTSYLALGNTTMDVFMIIFLAQCQTQLRILRLDLESMVEKCELECKDTSKPFTEIFDRKFLNAITRYNEIVNVCEKTMNIFGGSVLYLILTVIWVICTSAYVMINADPMSVPFSSMCLYIVCINTEIYIFCYYGNEVTYECYHLIDSVFLMDWHKVPLRQRYNIIIFMERIKRPIIPMAGGFVPLSNSTYILILRNSYSFYAFLNNTGG